MGWSGWTKDSTGPGEVNEKTVDRDDGSRDHHVMRTEDNSREGSRSDHSHVVVNERSDGSRSAHGHGIKEGKHK